MFRIAALAFVFCQSPQPPEGVALTDAQNFGVDQWSCHSLLKFAEQQNEAMRWIVVENNPRDVACTWLAEVKWRIACWDRLDTVLYYGFSEGSKLRCLAELRDLIGEENYYAGRMPSPVPQYKVPTR